jgi:hypothetical protein
MGLVPQKALILEERHCKREIQALNMSAGKVKVVPVLN